MVTYISNNRVAIAIPKNGVVTDRFRHVAHGPSEASMDRETLNGRTPFVEIATRF